MALRHKAGIPAALLCQAHISITCVPLVETQHSRLSSSASSSPEGLFHQLGHHRPCFTHKYSQRAPLFVHRSLSHPGLSPLKTSPSLAPSLRQTPREALGEQATTGQFWMDICWPWSTHHHRGSPRWHSHSGQQVVTPHGSVSRVNVHRDTHTNPTSPSRSGRHGSSPLCYALVYLPMEPGPEALAKAPPPKWAKIAPSQGEDPHHWTPASGFC